MRVPLSWLREYVDFDLTVEELAELFSLRSQEVDGAERLGVVSGEVVVGEVLEFGPHPNADKLSVAKVDLGGQEVQIVAGAPNPYPGARVPVVLPGSTLADGRKLKKVKLRGLESYGMMMSERELGISNDHQGILLLGDSYEVGRPLEDYFPIGEDVLEIDVMPNRPDLWGMIGIARELAAILKTSYRTPEPRFYRTPEPRFDANGAPTEDYGLRVEAEDLCPRYDLRRVSDVRADGKAPIWIRRRIYAAGMRPINAVVDTTNYVMLETGQPIHAFDAAKVRGGIVVRRAYPGERMTLLDGQTRTLDEEMLVIADEERGLVVAGVMGAEEAEVSETTSDVLIEVATFAGRNILETSQRLGLRTDASGRFERGLDPEMVSYTMDRVIDLLVETCDGHPAPDTLSHYPEPVRPWEVTLRLERAELLLGMPVELSEATERLELLGCDIQQQDSRLLVTVPTFRRDLRREADLVEEVGRLSGLESVPEVLPGVPQPGGLTPTQLKLRRLRYLLADLGLAEAVTYPFGPERWREDLGLENGDEQGAIRLRNPLSAEARSLRTTLLPGLLDATARNRAFGTRGGALFEVGRVFEPTEQPQELREVILRYRLSGDTGNNGTDNIPADLLMGTSEGHKVVVLLAGTVLPSGWNVPAFEVGFFEAKGLVERIVPGASFEARPEPFLHPGRAAAVLSGGTEVGWVGELHPEVAERFGLAGWAVSGFELELEATDPDPLPRFEPFYNVPAISMDLAVLVDEKVRVGDMLEAVTALRSPILADARVFDVYEGSQVPTGKKSVALNFTFQAEETLTDRAVKEELDRISERLRETFGAEVRSG